MAGMKMLMGAGAVVLGAVAADWLKANVVKSDTIADQPTETVLGTAAVIAGFTTGMPLLALAGAGALVNPIKSKVLALLPSGGTPVAGWPVVVGEMPSRAAVYALPPGMQHAPENLAASVAGLS